jgi:hypothetical protein
MLGYDHDTFWDQTPRTLSLTWQAVNELQIQQHNERAWQAWHTAGLTRARKFPQLQSLLAKSQTRQQSMEDQIEGLKAWVIATGGKVIYQQH